MNSWLGFSLSPEELSSQAQSLDGAQAVSGECVDLPPGSTSDHSGIMEVFNSGHQHQDHFSMNGMEQFMNFICNQNMCNLGNKLGGQSYGNQQHLSQCNNVSLHSQSFRNPSDYVFSDGAEGGSLNGCGGKNSVGNDNTEIVSSGLDGQNESNKLMPKKTIYILGEKTSTYRGVARHRWSGRYEAHLWDNSHRREGQTRKGRQVYLGGYDEVEKAARAYDLAALKYWGTTTTTNFPISNYERELEVMKNMTRQEYVASLRRNSSGFSRGVSIYRGVTRQHQHGRWIARVGRCAGNKELYLGLFNTQEEAAEAYDIAVIKVRGLNSVTNFDKSRYDVKRIMDQSSSTSLPIGVAKRLKENEQKEKSIDVSSGTSNDYNLALQLTDCNSNYYGSRGWAPCQEVHSCSVQEREHDNVGAHHGQSFRDLSNTQNSFQPAGLGQNFMDHGPTAFDPISNLDLSAYFDGGGAAANNVTAFAVPFSAKMDEQSGEGHWGKTMI